MQGFFTGQVGTQVSQQNKAEKNWKDSTFYPVEQQRGMHN